MADVILRPAERKDCSAIVNLIQELADFEKMPDGPKLKESDLERDGFDCSQPLFRCIVAESPRGLVGYALFYTIYSAWLGKCMFLEDLMVTNSLKGTGVGSKLFRSVVEVCRKENCPRLDFNVLVWNPARKFYEKHGAVNVTESEEWLTYRVHQDAISAMAPAL